MRKVIKTILILQTILFYTSCSDNAEVAGSIPLIGEDEKSTTPVSVQFEDSTVKVISKELELDSLINFEEINDGLTDSLKPPCGQVKKYKYHHFENAQPKKNKSNMSFPKSVRGTYYSSVNKNIKLIVTKDGLLYGEKNLDTIFRITPETMLKIERNMLLLNYLQSGEKNTDFFWITDQVIYSRDSISFKIIPVGLFKENPERKEIRDYLYGNNTHVETSFFR